MSLRPAHSKFSPSAASRWTTCTASVAYDVELLPAESTKSYAALGTYLHELGHRALATGVHPLDLPWDDALAEMVQGFDPSHPDHVLGEESKLVYPYVDFVRTEFLTVSGVFTSLEQTLEIFPGKCWGTADAVAVQDGVVCVVDYKSGSGVEVFAEENLQLLLYGIGARRKYEFLYDVEHVRHVIVQPPFGEPKEWTITAREQAERADEIEKIITRIENGEVVHKPSESNCRWCPVKTLCTAVEDLAIQAARDDFEFRMDLSDKMDLVPILRDWCKSIENEVKTRLLAGEDVEGYKVVEGRRSRTWTSEEEASQLLKREFRVPKSEQFLAPKFKSPAQIEALLKEKGIEFAERLASVITVNRGNPTVTVQNDRRKEVTKADLATQDFEDLIST